MEFEIKEKCFKTSFKGSKPKETRYLEGDINNKFKEVDQDGTSKYLGIIGEYVDNR